MTDLIDLQVDEKKKSKNSKALALIVSLVVVTNIVLGTALVLLFFSRKKAGQQNPKVMPDPYLDEEHKTGSDVERDVPLLWGQFNEWKPGTEANGSAEVKDDEPETDQVSSLKSGAILISEGDIAVQEVPSTPRLPTLDSESDDSVFCVSDMWDRRKQAP
jgi:cytoskeletal protein RodZ